MGRRGRLRALAPAITLALLAAFFLSATSSEDPRVFAILSTNAAPYREHLQRFEARFPGKVESATLGADPEALAAKLLSDPPDLVLALGAGAARFAKDARLPTPMMFTMVYDPKKHGLAAGDSACGLALKVPPEKTLAALEALWSKDGPAMRIGALHPQGQDRGEIDALRATLSKHGHRLIVREVASTDGLGSALDQLAPRVDALWLLMAPELVSGERSLDTILAYALDHRLAVVGLSDAHVKLGALVAVSVDYQKEGEYAAVVAMEVVGGKSVGEVGVRAPRNVIWSFNRKVADEIEWEVPAMVRIKFERVYE